MQGYVFKQCVTGGCGEGIGLCGEHIQELFTVYLTKFRTYKFVLPPQTKTLEERGPQTDKHQPPSPFTGQFLGNADIRDLSLLIIWSMSFLEKPIFHLSSIICLLYVGPWYAVGRCSLPRRYFRPRRPHSAANCCSGRPARRRKRCGGPATDCCHRPAPPPRPHKATRKRRRSSGGDDRRRPLRKNCRTRRQSCLNWRGDDYAVSY
jgi:hypothetical protein